MGPSRESRSHHLSNVRSPLAMCGRSIEADVASALTAGTLRAGGVTDFERVAATVGTLLGAWDAPLWEHSRRVAGYAAALAEQMLLPPAMVAEVRVAGLLHDLGKIALPPEVLHKPGRLTGAEYAIMRQHPARERELLGAARAPAGVVAMVGDHHERWDGSGYPVGQAGTDISLGGRILAVADALDSILRDREYSRGRSLAWALAEIAQCAGGQFDPAPVGALRRVAAARGPRFFDTTAPVIALHHAAAWKRRRAASAPARAAHDSPVAL